MNQHKDHRFIKGLLEHNNSIIKEIYSQFRPSIINYVKKNNGSLEDGKDLFQEGLRAILKMAIRENFTLDCSFFWLLKRICMNKWINRLKEKGQLPMVDFSVCEQKKSDDEERLKEKLEQEEQHDLLWGKIDELPDKCKVVMRLRLVQERKFAEIDRVMNYGKNGAKQAFQRCKKKLFKLFGGGDDDDDGGGGVGVLPTG